MYSSTIGYPKTIGPDPITTEATNSFIKLDGYLVIRYVLTPPITTYIPISIAITTTSFRIKIYYDDNIFTHLLN